MALDGSDFKVDGSQFFGGISQLTGMDPVAFMIDKAGDALGLPPAIRNVAKIAIGMATSDVLCIASGASGLAAEAAKEEPATTEVVPNKDPGIASAGYCSTQPTYGPQEGFDMNSAEFKKWIPADPYLAGLRQQAVTAESQGCDASKLWAKYKQEVKFSLAAKTDVRVDFESSFGMKLVTPNGAAGPNELIVRRRTSSATQSSDGPSQTMESDSPHEIQSSGTGTANGPVRTSGAEAKIESKLEGVEAQLKELDGKSELSEKEMRDYQKLMQKKSELFNLLTNISAAEHEMAMAAIHNIR